MVWHLKQEYHDVPSYSFVYPHILIVVSGMHRGSKKTGRPSYFFNFWHKTLQIPAAHLVLVKRPVWSNTLDFIIYCFILHFSIPSSVRYFTSIPPLKTLHMPYHSRLHFPPGHWFPTLALLRCSHMQCFWHHFMPKVVIWYYNLLFVMLLLSLTC